MRAIETDGSSAGDIGPSTCAVFDGGDGSDMITTGTADGNDTFNGGEGIDAITLSGNGATARGGNDFVQAFNEPTSNTFSGSARLYGEAGDDNIFGASDFLSGRKGRDYLADSGPWHPTTSTSSSAASARIPSPTPTGRTTRRTSGHTPAPRSKRSGPPI